MKIFLTRSCIFGVGCGVSYLQLENLRSKRIMEAHRDREWITSNLVNLKKFQTQDNIEPRIDMKLFIEGQDSYYQERIEKSEEILADIDEFLERSWRGQIFAYPPLVKYSEICV